MPEYYHGASDHGLPYAETTYETAWEWIAKIRENNWLVPEDLKALAAASEERGAA